MIKNIESLIIDMDGVLWRENVPIGNLPEIFARIRAHGWKFIFATNNGTRTPGQYLERLAEFGVEVDEWQVITSALGMAQMLKGKIPEGCSIFVIGEEGVKAALQDQGYRIATIESAEEAQAVVMGIDHDISYEKMCEATLLVRRGVPFYATNPDMTFPTPRGEIPGAGAWISVIVTATGIKPIYAGKPYPFLMEMALERLGTKKGETLVVGDRLETDIAAGQTIGCPTALVLSGVSTRGTGGSVASTTRSHRPRPGSVSPINQRPAFRQVSWSLWSNGGEFCRRGSGGSANHLDGNRERRAKKDTSVILQFPPTDILPRGSGCDKLNNDIDRLTRSDHLSNGSGYCLPSVHSPNQ